MRTKRRGYCVGIALFLLSGITFSQEKSLSIGSATGSKVTLPVTLSTDEPVEGFVLSIRIDPTKLLIVDVRAAGATLEEGAEFIAPSILPEGATLGVVMDMEEPFAGQTISPGTNRLIAQLELEAQTVPACGRSETASVVFRDGLGNPPLRNILVVSGRSLGEAEGLVLKSGTVTVPGICGSFRIQSTTGNPGDRFVRVPILLDFGEPVEGYMLAVAHEAGVKLSEISLEGTDAEAVGVEFSAPRIYPHGGTLGVIFDFKAHFEGQVLHPDDSNSLAAFVYEYEPFECSEDGGNGKKSFDLLFKDEVLGDPPVSNLVVVRGQGVHLPREDGSVTFQCQAGGDIDYYVGTSTPPPFHQIVCAEGTPGAQAKVTFFYTSLSKPIQGMSMAVCYPRELRLCDLDLHGQGALTGRHLAETMTEAISAEFVSFNGDNEKGELIIGILVDATPPVPLSHMFPSTDIPYKVLNVYFEIPEDATCHTEYTLSFCDGATGAGSVPIFNRAAVFNRSYPVRTHAGCIRVLGRGIFIRGDCNGDGQVDIADSPAVSEYLFLGDYVPPCLDACDSNDDGIVSLSDVTFSLRYLFKFGPMIPPPGPFPPGGLDPTPDAFGLDLGCESGTFCE